MTKRLTLTYKSRRTVSGYIFILPWLIGFITFFIRPFIQTVIYSLSDVKVKKDMTVVFASLKHYAYAFTEDPEFLRQLIGVIGQLLVNLPVIIVLSFSVATVLNQKFMGRTLARAVFFLPVIISTSAIFAFLKRGYFGETAYVQDATTFIFNSVNTKLFLEALNLNSVFVEYIIAIISSIFDMIWHTGLQIIIFLTGLQSIPTQLYEVAKIEGASSWSVFWKITFVMMGPITLLNVVYTMIQHFSFAIFDLFNDLQTQMKYSYASAVTLMYVAVVLLLIFLTFTIGNKIIKKSL